MAMKENKLRQLLNEGKPSVSTRLWSPWAFYAEALGSTGKFDYMEFVAEYAPFTQYDLENMCRASELFDMGSMIDHLGARRIPGGRVPARPERHT